MNRALIAGGLASLVLVAASVHTAVAAVVYAKLSTIQEEGSDPAAGLAAVAPADTIAGTLNVIWSQETAEPTAGPHADLELRGASAGADRLEPPELADPAMSLGDSAPSLANTLGGETFASTGDHRPVEVGFLPSIPSPTTDPVLPHDGNASGGAPVPVRAAPIVTSTAKEAAPLVDLRILLILLGILGAIAVGFVAGRRRLAKN